MQDSKHYFEDLVISPIPKTLTDYKELYYFDPTLGDGLLIVSFKISPKKFDQILKARNWEKGNTPADRSLIEKYKEIFHEQEKDLEYYSFYPKDKPSSYGKLFMVVNKKHDKVIIRGQI
jgi:hypothetical protein